MWLHSATGGTDYEQLGACSVWCGALRSAWWLDVGRLDGVRDLVNVLGLGLNCRE